MLNWTKIRKNATRQIEALLNEVTYVTVDVEQRNFLDDSFDCVTQQTTVDALREYMADSYNGLVVYLVKDEDGNVDHLRVSLTGWSKKTFFAFFKPNTSEIASVNKEIKVEKPKMTLAMVQAYIAKGFQSPLCHDAQYHEETETDEVKQIVSVKINWSETRHFDTGMVLNLDEYARLEALSLVDEREYGNLGYSKNSCILTLANGDVVNFRHDICIREKNLSTQWALFVDYARKNQKVMSTHNA